MQTETADCRKAKAAMVDMLFAPAAAAQTPQSVQTHLEQCGACRQELQAMRRTMSLLDDWHAPEPSAYFNPRMTAKLREEQSHGSQSFFERLRIWVLLSNLHLKPLAGGALALALVVGGGTYYETTQSAPAPQASATVRDLQSLDENAQVFQQLNNLDQPDGDDGNGSGNSL